MSLLERFVWHRYDGSLIKLIDNMIWLEEEGD